MEKRFLTGALVVCLALLLLAGTAPAQNQRTGTSAAPELLIPVGARDMAMAGSSIATVEGVEGLYWNPAGVGRMHRAAEGMFSTMSYIADIQVSYGAVAAKFGDFGTVGLSFKSLDFGDIPLTTVADPTGLSGAVFSPNYITLGLTYSRELTDAIAAGITVKLVSERIDRVSSSGTAFDFGLQYNGLVGARGLALGVAVKNIGGEMKFDGPGLLRTATSSEGDRPEQRYTLAAGSFELPATIEIGLSYTGNVGDNMQYGLNGVYASNNLYLDQYKLGGEYGFLYDKVKIFARGGYELVPQIENKEANIWGPALGFGLVYDAGGVELTVDFAYRAAKYFDGNNTLSLKVGF